jgi:3'-phosphoadenosine 5'-phosphosulfate sulfotransferase (PAPS reductase)/FAD synthetase
MSETNAARLEAPALKTDLAAASAARVRRAARKTEKTVRPDTTTILPLNEYDLIVCCFSGGKDSLAALLDVLDRCREAGVPPSRVEAWHHLVDGDDPNGLFDWPVTDAYCAAVCKALGVVYRRSWRVGGLEGELLKENARSKGVAFENPSGGVTVVGGTNGKVSTRRRWPAKTHDLKVRWCSGHGKIDVCNSAIANDPRLHNAKVLVVTGERRDESDARALYATALERNGTTKNRRVDHWRMILDRDEAWVWDKIRRHRVRPHVAYFLGFGRVSCLTCIFHDADGWASVKDVAPARLERVALREKELGHTINPPEKPERLGLTVVEMADAGESFARDADPENKALAMRRKYPAEKVIVPAGEEWVLPSGAFRPCCGPS